MKGKGNSFKLKEWKFGYKEKNYERDNEAQEEDAHRVVDTPILEAFKVRLDGTLSSLAELWLSVFTAWELD